jgi:hypothetical protein
MLNERTRVICVTRVFVVFACREIEWIVRTTLICQAGTR